MIWKSDRFEEMLYNNKKRISLGAISQTVLLGILVCGVLSNIIRWGLEIETQQKSAAFLCIMNNSKKKVRRQFPFKIVLNCIN